MARAWGIATSERERAPSEIDCGNRFASDTLRVLSQVASVGDIVGLVVEGLAFAGGVFVEPVALFAEGAVPEQSAPWNY